MATVAQVLREAAARIAPVSESPRLDAEILLASSLNIRRSVLLAMMRDTVSAPGFETLVARRAAAEPIAYILGSWEFFGLEFEVRPPLLVPRPETEHLVEVALDFIRDSPANVLDLGTGTGCVAIAIAYNAPHARVMASDISPLALEVSEGNARRHGVPLRLMQGDLFDAIATNNVKYRAIVSNPPYVPDGEWDTLPQTIRHYEDRGALLAGLDGLSIIHRIIAQAQGYLESGGMLALEIGEDQFGRVASILEEAGYRGIRCVKDLAGIQRIAIGIAP